MVVNADIPVTATFAVPPFTVTTVGDYGNVTVMEVTGNYDARNPEGSINALPREEIAKEFLRRHSDNYDFIVIFSNFDFSMPTTEAKAYYMGIKNDIRGIGSPIFDSTALFGSSGKLQGLIEMGNISGHALNPADPQFETTLLLLAHEKMHRWGARVKFKEQSGALSTALLGEGGEHWSFLLDSEASLLYGNDWKDNGNGAFTSIDALKRYSPLDLYLMGMYDKSRVSPVMLIENASIDPTRYPEVGATISGTAKSVSIEDIIAAEGERIPNAADSQKTFKIAYVLIERPGTFTGTQTSGIENVRSAWAGRFNLLTEGRGSIEDVAPSMTIEIASPVDGATINSPDVMVRGAVINSTGKETGVTVNGIPATVYGTQFTANGISLMERANTITVAATDTAGNTASKSITVNKVSTGYYIHLTANPESGIAPLETTLRIDGSFTVTNPGINVTGPAAVQTLTSANPDEYGYRMTAEGVYLFTAQAIGPDGNAYQDTIAVTVMSKTQLDNLLRVKWEGMKTALANQDIQGAAGYFSLAAKEKYSNVFSIMANHLSEIVAGMNETRMDYITGDSAEYRINRMENIDGQMKEITYFIYFVKDGDGLWKIESF
jgi:hypothetical protein